MKQISLLIFQNIQSRQKVTNKKQFELMVGILEENPAVAKGLKFAECASLGRGHFNDVWTDITATLNSAGPPTRKTTEWQKVRYLFVILKISLTVRFSSGVE